MPSSRQLTELAARKALILAQSDLHRQLLALEGTRWRRRSDATQAFGARNRWWLLGGVAVVGLVIARRWRGFSGWLPPIIATARALWR